MGSVRAIPDNGRRSPSGLVVFSFTSGGKTVSEAGVPALPAGSAFRVPVDAFGTPEHANSIRTGLAIANTAPTSTDGDPGGHRHRWIDGGPTGHAFASTFGSGCSFHRRYLRLAAGKLLGSAPGHFDRPGCGRRVETADQRTRGTEGDDDHAIERNGGVDHGGSVLPTHRGLRGLVHAVHPVQREGRRNPVWNIENNSFSARVTARSANPPAVSIQSGNGRSRGNWSRLRATACHDA